MNLISRLLSLLFALCLAHPLIAGAPTGPIRVLFLGHESTHHDSSKVLPMLMERLGRDAIWFDYFTHPDQCLDPETLGHYDAVLLYANHGRIKPEQFDALNTFVESGHGFLPIHCASACFGNDPRFIALVGGRFKSHKTDTFQTRFLIPNHPVLAGVTEYQTWDETYVHDSLSKQGRTLLAERIDGEHHEPWTWVRTQGKGRVFYTASGHDERTWSNDQFQKLLKNAIIWSVGDDRKAAWENFLTSRGPEQREPNPFVANYEKRPEAITLQKPLAVQSSIQRTQVPADMHLELFASEPNIGKPIAMAWDERGRLWLAETRDYPHDVKEDGKGNDRILICEDTDGDGKADKFTVFAEGLNIPTGIVFANGGVIVSQPPRFLFLKSSKGDDHADIRQEILPGWGIRDTHAQASNLHYGLDNWLYGAVGYSGFSGTVAGKELKFAQGTYRFRPDGSALEFLHQFSNNTWGHSINDAGDQFGGTANNAPIFYGGIPATLAPAGMNLMSAKKINVEDKAHPITPNYRQVDVFKGYTAACGSSFIYSPHLPARLQGKAMVCEPTMKLIALMDVQKEGAGYVAKDGFNLVASSDEWMSPVCAEVGPDGAVWFCDWQNFIIQHNPTPSLIRGGFEGTTGIGGAHENPLRDHGRGRIYRVVWNKAPKGLSKSLPADAAKSRDWVAALNDPNPFWRTTAQRLLVEGKTSQYTDKLRALVSANDGQIGAVHALWTLHGLGQLDEPTHRAALTARDSRLRRNATRALGADEPSRKLFFSASVISDPDPLTKLAAWIKLAEFDGPQIQSVIRGVQKAAVAEKDEWLKQASRLLLRKHNLPEFKEGPNLLTNPGLESLAADGLPEGWKRRDYGAARAEANAKATWSVTSDPKEVHSGKHAIRCVSKAAADTSFHLDVPVKSNTLYRLSAWIRTSGVKGKASLNDHIGRAETNTISKDKPWTEVEAIFDSKERTKASINILFVGEGTAWWDDLKLCEIAPIDEAAPALEKGDALRGEQLVFKHAAACILCHAIKGQGSAVGPALDGIATRATQDYIKESLLEPNKILAKGYEQLGVSPMPPMATIFNPQQLEDIQAYLQTLK